MDESPLGKLSAELRNIIYELVLVSPGTIHIKNCLKTDPGRAIVWERDSERPNGALLRTCKQIQQEATSILYHDNVFTFTSHRDDSALAFESFIKVIGPNSAAFLRSCLVDCFRIDQLIPEKCEDLDREVALGGKKVLALTQQMPQCSITAIVQFCISDMPIRIWNHEINFSSPAKSFSRQWFEMFRKMMSEVLWAMQAQFRFHYLDPRHDMLHRLHKRMNTVAFAVAGSYKELVTQKAANLAQASEGDWTSSVPDSSDAIDSLEMLLADNPI